MTAETYHMFLSGSHISWKTPAPSGYTTCAVVLIPEKDLLRVRHALRAVSRQIKHRLRPYLHKQTAVDTHPVVALLSRLLGELANFSFLIPSRGDDGHINSYDRILPEVFQRIESHLQESGARGALYSNYPSLLGWCPTQQIAKFFGVGPHREELILAEFCDWVSGQRLWQNSVLSHYHDQVANFEEWLRTFPLLGGYHALAGPLMDQLGRAPAYTIGKESWFRGRCSTDTETFDTSQMGPPPPHLTTEGRYNHAGKPSLYLSSDEGTCGAEISDGVEGTGLWIQQFEISAKRLLDLTFHPDLGKGFQHDESELLLAAIHSAIGHPSNHGSAWKPEYYVTRFIADVIRCKGYDGIRFNSTRGRGLNLALFHWESDVCRIGEPNLISHMPVSNVSVIGRECGLPT